MMDFPSAPSPSKRTYSESFSSDDEREYGLGKRPPAGPLNEDYERQTLQKGRHTPLPIRHANINNPPLAIEIISLDMDGNMDDSNTPKVSEVLPLNPKRKHPTKTRIGTPKRYKRTKVRSTDIGNHMINSLDISPIGETHPEIAPRRNPRRQSKATAAADTSVNLTCNLSAAHLPRIEVQDDEMANALIEHQRQYGTLKRPRDIENIDVLEYLINHDQMSELSMSLPAHKKQRNSVNKEITKYSKMSSKQVETHLRDKIGVSPSVKSKTTLKKKDTLMEYGPITFEQFARENSPGSKKDDRKPFADEKNTTQKPISEFFEFSNPTLHNSIPARPTTSNISIHSGLRIMTVNAQCGLYKRIEEIFVDVMSNNIDVLCVTETGFGVNNSKPAKIVSLCTKNNYRLISGPYLDSDMNKNSHICFIVKKSLVLKNESIQKCGRIINFEVVNNPRNLRIMGLYQGFKKENNEKLRKIIKKWIQSSPDNVVLCGDLNEILSRKDAWTIFNDQSKEHPTLRNKGDTHRLLYSLGLVDIPTFMGMTGPNWTHVQSTTG